MDVYERLEDMAADTAEARAAHILHGLGFTAKMQKTPTKDFSGGWRMRIALARYAKTLYTYIYIMWIKTSLICIQYIIKITDIEKYFGIFFTERFM